MKFEFIILKTIVTIVTIMSKRHNKRRFGDTSSEEDDEEYFPETKAQDKISLNESITSKNEGKETRGRPKIQEQWSRVICISDDDLTNIRSYDLAPDLLLSDGMKFTAARGKAQTDWQPLFWPDEYVK